MANAILVLNCGSSSIKFEVFRVTDDAGMTALLRGQISGIGTAPVFKAKDRDGTVAGEKAWDPAERLGTAPLLAFLIDWIEGHLGDDRLVAAGHRVVHGGAEYAAPVLVTPEVFARLEALVPLAPLHQPHNLAPIKALAELHPELPQVACFDTAFHRGHSDAASRFAIPRDLDDAGIRRYGFHGLSYEYISRSLRARAPEVAAGKVVVCHLGSGASLCGIDNGRSIDSTMGFTALDGLPMGTRCGALDAGVVLHLMTDRGMDAKSLTRLLYNQSGLLGMSGISNDMRDLLASDREEARQAIDVFVYRIVREIGAMAFSMGGLDGLVFTAGIGERSEEIRAMVCHQLTWFGLILCPEANKTGGPLISRPHSRVSTWVIPTDEERMIALHTTTLLAATNPELRRAAE